MNASNMLDPGISIQFWTLEHPRWADLLAVVEQAGQQRWFEFTLPEHVSAHVLVALKDEAVVGLLRFVVQPIGPVDNYPPLTLDGAALTEAKIIAFAVLEAHQGQGIRRRLQEAAIEKARVLGCYQLRSFSDVQYVANHHLKLRLGFGAHPVHENGREGVYYVLPLNSYTER